MKFEYMAKPFYLDSIYAFQQQLNELGQEGWELVTIVSTTTPFNPTNKIFDAYFKREIERETQVLK